MIELLGCGGEKDMVTWDGEDVRVGGCYRKSVVGVLARDLWWCSMLGLRDAFPKSLEELGLLMGWLQAWVGG